jgi:hypothetical protein
MATTTNDAIYLRLVDLYPDAGKTLGDLLYTFWVEKGLEYRGTLQFEFLKSEGAVGNTLGDLMNSYFIEPSFFVSFDINDAGDILEYEIFGFTYDLRQEIFGW